VPAARLTALRVSGLHQNATADATCPARNVLERSPIRLLPSREPATLGIAATMSDTHTNDRRFAAHELRTPHPKPGSALRSRARPRT